MRKSALLERIYFLLALGGLLLTWFFNGQYLAAGGGLGPDAFFGAAFANALTTAITLDVYWSALVFSLWVFNDAKHAGVSRPWIYVAICFGVGLAIALPLYLALCERAKSRIDIGLTSTVF